MYVYAIYDKLIRKYSQYTTPWDRAGHSAGSWAWHYCDVQSVRPQTRPSGIHEYSCSLASDGGDRFVAPRVSPGFSVYIA